MKIKSLSQLEFPALLYDSLFALILFFGFDSFLDIKDGMHFALYIFSNFVVIHWWLLFKATDDTFEKGIRESAVGILVNLAVITILDIMLLNAAVFRYETVAMMLVLLLAVDMIWLFFVYRFEKWQKFSKAAEKGMKEELRIILRQDLTALLPLLAMMLFAGFFQAPVYVAVLIAIYSFYIYLTFRDKIIDIPVY